MKMINGLTNYVYIFGTLTWSLTAFLIFKFGSDGMLPVKIGFLVLYYPFILYVGTLLDKARKDGSL
jgi:uncharacterized membrane protein